MKRNLLALAVGAAIAMPGVALADAATIYGRMDVSLDRVDIDNDTGLANDSGSNWEVNSHASRFGVKGDADLGAGLTALYKIEWQVDADDGSDTLKARNRYVGLKGGFGTTLLGKMDSPMKTAQGKFDLFDNWAGDITNVVEGEVRASNTVAYITPKIAGVFTGKAALILVEENEADGCKSHLDNTDSDFDVDDCEDGLTDAYSLSVAYEDNGLYAALAYDNNMPSTNIASLFAAPIAVSVVRVDTVRLVGVYKIDALQLGVLYSQSDVEDEFLGFNIDVDQTALILNAAYTAGENTFKIQYGMSDIDADTSKDEEKTVLSLGAEHAFNKQTKVYAYYTAEEIDNTVFVDGVDSSESALAFGMQHKF
ncbi:MAG: porin [Pseudomonadales bacterium]|nr:porin [Pseudomonadales bacterium]